MNSLHRIKIVIFIPLLIFMNFAIAQVSEGDYQSCLLRALNEAAPELTVAEIRASCSLSISAGSNESVDSNLSLQSLQVGRQSGLSIHHPNFLLPFTYNDNPNQILQTLGIDEDFDKVEAEFQVSLKFPIIQGFINENTDLMMGYTSRSWWQVYNKDLSSPFRETNYQPEIFLRHYPSNPILGTGLNSWDLGFVHESNGRSQTFSRSWNRIYASANFSVTDSLSLGLKSWYRLPEDADEDDNPRIYKYRGYGEARAVYQANKHIFSVMYRPGTEEYGLELTWSYPINEHLRIYTKLFNGYGESLLDYNHKVERIGIGFAINDFYEIIGR